MKILILTQSLGKNYGGVMQAYALQTILRDMGHDVVTDNREVKYAWRDTNWIFIIYRFFRKNILGQSQIVVSHQKYINKIYGAIQQFVKRKINTIDFRDKKNISDYDAIVVGSDQVWRPIYNRPNPAYYFLDFAADSDIKKIAYSASFGVDNISEYSPALLDACANLIKKFDAISVREDSAVDLCRNYFNINAVHTLDPVFLLDKEHYMKLIDSNDIDTNCKKIMYYILDKSQSKNDIVEIIQNKLKLELNVFLPNIHDCSKKNKMKDLAYPSVSKWLSSFANSDFVVTDSFHGVVFALVFNKSFVVIANKERGISRLTSLLKIFNLEHRLIFSVEDIDEKIYENIDFSEIEKIKKNWQASSFSFLEIGLS